METLLAKLGEAVENGKVDKNSPYPPQMKGQDGADELAKEAIDNGVDPTSILTDALVPAMDRVGQKFSENKIFVPQMLMSAKAMGAAMNHLKPFFQSGDVQTKGTFIIGTEPITLAIKRLEEIIDPGQYNFKIINHGKFFPI